MKFFDRYINGEDGRAVYTDIHSLGKDAFTVAHFEDIQNVLIETFNRVAFNLNVIFSELKKLNYAFKSEFQCNLDRPLLAPLPNTHKLLIELEEAVKDFGYIPLSLRLFYEIVGSVDFGWDYENKPELLWSCADPLQINSLDDLVSYVADGDWATYMEEGLDTGDSLDAYLEVAADYLHKDNISGGPPYSIQITREPSIDSLFLNEGNETTFIGYLRICMENCGFPGIAKPEFKNDYKAFFERTRPLLKNI
jgi:hypothetical protein